MMIDMIRIDEEKVQKVSKVIRDFLMKHGGAVNGYHTYVRGTVHPDDPPWSQWLEWSTPGIDEYKVSKIKKLGRKLYERVHLAAEMDDGVDYMVILEAILEGEVFYSTIIRISTYGSLIELG